jgi:predicted RNase H-like HicB family nuclease
MHVHEQVLAAANRIAGQRNDWIFTPEEIIKSLPGLNQSSVRTDIVSRCCVNAPQNHLRKWDYFQRVGRGTYQIRSEYRSAGMVTAENRLRSRRSARPGDRGEPNHVPRRDVIHAVVHADQDAFTAACLEIAAVTQGDTLDEVVRNLNEVVALYFEDEDLAEMGFSDHLRLQVIFEAPLVL